MMRYFHFFAFRAGDRVYFGAMMSQEKANKMSFSCFLHFDLCFHQSIPTFKCVSYHRHFHSLVVAFIIANPLSRRCSRDDHQQLSSGSRCGIQFGIIVL